MPSPHKEPRLEQRIISAVKASPETHDLASLYYHFGGEVPFATLQRTVKTLVFHRKRFAG